MTNKPIPPLKNTWGKGKGKVPSLKEQLKTLPEEPTFDDYIERPVEGYGEAILQGYRDKKEKVPNKEYDEHRGRKAIGPLDADVLDKGRKDVKLMSPKTRGPGKNERNWTEEEDVVLIEVVKDLVDSGKFKAENGFNPGFLNVLEEILKFKLPEAGIQAEPHINSRLRHFRAVHAVIHDMVTGPSTSGFGWDSDKQMVTASEEVWNEYLKAHPKANQYKNKPCPYYEDLCIIFGKDRANGAEARDGQDLEDDVNKEEATTEVESSSTQGPPENGEI